MRRDTRGVSAIEFALLLPVMVLLLAATVDVSEALTVSRKMRQISSIVADLVAQSSRLSQSEVATILAGSAQVLNPYPGAKLSIVVSVIDVESKEKQDVLWSYGFQAAALAKGTSIAVPNAISVKGVQLVRAEVHYSFTTMFSGYLSTLLGRDGYAMSDVMYQRPRVSDTIDLAT
jgi:Flp pilus assembly protein TadG